MVCEETIHSTALSGFWPHWCANPRKRNRKMVQGLNMKTVTVRETLKQTLKASFPGPSAMRKDKPAKSFRPPRPNTWASSYFELPTPHAQTAQESCLSPFILVPFGYTSVYAKPLPKSLPSSCHCVLAAAFWGLQRAAPVFRGGTGWWGWWQGVGRVCGPRNCSHFYLVSKQFQQCSRRFLANVSTDGFNFSPLPPSWGVPAPLHILWQLGLWTSCGRFGLSYFLLPDCSSSFLLSHKTYLSIERLLRPVRRRQSHQPHKLRDVIPRSRPLVSPAPTVVVAFYLCPVMFFHLHPPPLGLVMAAKKRHTFSLFKKTQEESGNVTEESWLDRKRSCVLWKF